MIVADTDFVSSIYILTTHTAHATAAMERDRNWIAPANQEVELLNVFSKYLRARQISLEGAKLGYHDALKLCNRNVEAATTEEILELSLMSGTSAYDAMYVWLARHRGVRLVTGDRALIRGAPDVAVSIEDFADGR